MDRMHWTKELLERAIELKRNMTWQEVGIRLNTSANSVKQAVAEYKKKRNRLIHCQRKVIKQQIVADIELGMSVREAAIKYGRRKSSIRGTILTVGIDGEMLREIRNGLA